MNKSLRWRLACALAALYALCILLPAAAFAFSGAPAHCLTDAGSAHVHRANAEPAHVHGDGSVHSHAKPSPHRHADSEAEHDHDAADGKSGSNCCGLFCLSAIGSAVPAFTTTAFVGTRTACALADVLTGRSPDRINRPPIG